MLDDKQLATMRLAWRMHTSTQGPMPSELAVHIYKLMDRAGVCSLDSERQFKIKMTEAIRNDDENNS
jgi:hypothetical protein